MNISKIPRMEKYEYDNLIKENYICRIAFRGESFPYIVPFLYSFDGKFLYFLPTRYGRKIDYFHKDPHVSVEIEYYSNDFSSYKFITLQGTLEEINDNNEIKKLFYIDVPNARIIAMNKIINFYLDRFSGEDENNEDLQ